MCYSDGYSGLAIADYFIEKARQQQIPITNMAVLKMIYFAHGLAYPILDRKLIRDPFVAWKWGPVELHTYNEFSKYDSAPILQPSGKTTHELNSIYAKPELCQFLDQILPLAKFDPFALSDKTHENGAPWSLTPRLKTIDDKLIKDYFCNECAAK